MNINVLERGAVQFGLKTLCYDVYRAHVLIKIENEQQLQLVKWAT